jgi:dTDP-glucose 4,6-dehydratase
MILVTGGAGFIGSNFVLEWLERVDEPVVNVDKLTYAGNLSNLASLRQDQRHLFVAEDICNPGAIRQLLNTHRPRAMVHFAAESHVDRSIHGPGEFIQTNIVGTFSLLQEARAYWSNLSEQQQRSFRFLHVSTDEVYGSLAAAAPAFTEQSQYQPNSPYSASKAAADHLVRAYHHTYGLPTIITNCSNNYGPYQFPEKLIPLTINNALHGKPLPVYGDGSNVRDWLYVADHCTALRTALERGTPGEMYNIGGRSEQTNLEVVRSICEILDELKPSTPVVPYEKLITFVRDRPGHDFRYAINLDKIATQLGWTPIESFSSGLRKTVQWYLEHQDWVRDIVDGRYRDWMDLQYGDATAARPGGRLTPGNVP